MHTQMQIITHTYHKYAHITYICTSRTHKNIPPYHLQMHISHSHPIRQVCIDRIQIYHTHMHTWREHLHTPIHHIQTHLHAHIHSTHITHAHTQTSHANMHTYTSQVYTYCAQIHITHTPYTHVFHVQIHKHHILPAYE